MKDRLTQALDLLKAAKELATSIAGEKTVSLRLDCLVKLGISTTTIQVGNAFAKWARGLGKNDVKLPIQSVYNVRVFELKPLVREITEAVQRTEDGFVLDFKRCLESEMCRLEVQYRMEDSFLNSLVHCRSSPEPLGEETKFHLSAQLTDPESLVKGFSEVEINDFPVTTRVYVKENIDVAIPGLDTFRDLRKLETDMFSNYDPRAGFKMAGLQRRRFELKRRLRQENPRDVLRALNMLLLPAHFRTYIRLERDFRYHTCNWGLGKMEMPGNVFLPEDLDIITRTDLALTRHAASGVLHYDIGKFSRDVQEALKSHGVSERGRFRKI